jgi:acetyl esterase/lipase
VLTGALIGIAIAAMLGLAWLAPGRVFNRLVPKDGGSRLIARALEYGPEPRHRLDLYGPREGQGPWPVVLYVHGGSWASGSRRSYDFVGRALAAQGFVVAIPDYRLFPEVRFPSFLEDCALAVAWSVRAAATHGGDPARLALLGHSAGAYNAAMLALDERWLAGAGAPGVIRAWAGLAGPYDFLPLDSPITKRTFGGVEHLAETQPVNFVRTGAPPAFLAHGDRDRTVAPRHTTKLAALLRDAGVAVEEHHYAGVGHLGIAAALARPLRRRVPVLAEVTAFLRRHLGD